MTRRAIAKVATTAVAGVLLAGGVTVATPGTALAARSDCERGANGFRDIPDNQTGVAAGPADKVLRPSDPQGLVGRIGLGAARIDGDVYGFAALAVPRVGDEIWMDWTLDGNRVHIQCGPFKATRDGHQLTSAARVTDSNPNYRFRACGGGGGQAVQCTDWW
ncbi:hypothetical protein SLINC_0219 [Streptomyces lincolnensis]|uniref:Uncharacterized protein n=1 Tax=Streptomyces lincolnensis TaxID=1915 RepID=A0A1B1M1Y9_STRLN|nr:hypothetical protein [Streptomyces lincolnensis]ANS62443.1 hypothetical protein SLINC_0219 [Streptomyces lincolnensis]AXG51368.1 hypothetical protein SLCG_0213 [Streptomyces lincolnensis]QMV04433.1 hypothetical protein GJU35_01310 [Streptomyces lincolnensis]QMV11891.1 hypothetical protein GJU35_43610 [Streptomyces lincolnensis]